MVRSNTNIINLFGFRFANQLPIPTYIAIYWWLIMITNSNAYLKMLNSKYFRCNIWLTCRMFTIIMRTLQVCKFWHLPVMYVGFLIEKWKLVFAKTRYIRQIDWSPAILTSDDFIRSNEIVRRKWQTYQVIRHFVLTI